MKDKNIDTKQILAEARAIHFAMRNGAITYQEAKIRTKPYLACINGVFKSIGEKHKMKATVINFQDLGSNL